MGSALRQGDYKCPIEPETAMAAADHQAPPELMRYWETHSEGCTDCRSRLEEAQRLRSFSRAVMSPVEPPAWLLERSLQRARQAHHKSSGLRRRAVLCLAFGALGIGLVVAAMMLQPREVPFDAVMSAYEGTFSIKLDYTGADPAGAEQWLKQHGFANTANYRIMLKKGVFLKGVKVVKDAEGDFVVWEAEWNGTRVAGIQPPRVTAYPPNVGQVMLGQEFGFAATVGTRMVLISPCKEADFFLVIEEPDKLESQLQDSYFNCK